ncbi:sugar ABC transporter permease [Aphanothece hegewaldii CCALA 016]|uniref:Cytosine-specific methyltransferase n=1 Tax=Aphanothece hegewaldii CCALA 016 TaxID=2107694 RepID=A0A2T1LXR4_9CHRO|nr:DNA (cytosine-5-)-methyltransferase [Aphanothece hegewaldii]PSF37185.1 sugar ABC transporter permease [Aphanothece hegewaldii CCALA 016]
MQETSGSLTILNFKQESSSIPNHIARQVSPDVQRRINALKIGQKMQDLPEELWHTSFRYYVKEDENRRGGPNLRIIRLNPEMPSLTVTAYIFNKFVHPYENRYISVREAARLQGFSDSLEFKGTQNSTQLQVGNAVPVQLAKAVFDQVIQHTEKVRYKLGQNLTAMSLFSGAGGMDIGADCTGRIKTLLAIDSWQDACDTLSGYYNGRCDVLQQDVVNITNPLKLWQSRTGETREPDLVFGGPPCQAFSQAGKQKGLDDDRAQMIFEFIRFIKDLSPAFFVMENVANLKGIGEGTIFKKILKSMEDLQYEITTGLLLSADFGVPQLRKRLFFLGSRREFGKIPLPYPTHSAMPGLFTLPYLTVGEAFAGLPLLPINYK